MASVFQCFVHFNKTCPRKYDCVNISQSFFWLCARSIWCHVVLLRSLLKMQKIHINFPPIKSGASIWICMTCHRGHMGTFWRSLQLVGNSTKDCCSSCFPGCLFLGNVPLNLMGQNSLLLFHSVQRDRLVPELTCHKLSIYYRKLRAACHLSTTAWQNGWKTSMR